VFLKIVGFIVEGALFLLALPLFILWGGFKLDAIFGITSLLRGEYVILVGALLLLLGLFWILWAGYSQLVVGGGTPLPALPTVRLVVVGPYKFCRNPMTLGSFLYYLGLAFLQRSVGAVLLTLAFLLLALLYVKLVEEKKLLQRFGEEYKRYRERTPLLFPSFSPSQREK